MRNIYCEATIFAAKRIDFLQEGEVNDFLTEVRLDLDCMQDGGNSDYSYAFDVDDVERGDLQSKNATLLDNLDKQFAHGGGSVIYCKAVVFAQMTVDDACSQEEIDEKHMNFLTDIRLDIDNMQGNEGSYAYADEVQAISMESLRDKDSYLFSKLTPEPESFRRSERKFPTEAKQILHNAFASGIKENIHFAINSCVFDFRIPPEMVRKAAAQEAKAADGAHRKNRTR